MYKIRIIIVSVLAVLLSGCIKDMGNYSYLAEADAITISDEMSRNPLTSLPMTFTQDEEVIIPLKYTVNDPNLMKEDLSFAWYLGGEIVGTEETLNLGYMAPAAYGGVVVIIDNRYGIEYSHILEFTVTTIYTDGWAVLSDNGLKSELGYLSKDGNTGEWGFVPDVYGKANEGASLVTGAGPLTYHYYNTTAPQVFGLTVYQPGDEGPLDLNAQDMTLFGKFKENFIGEVPEDDITALVWNSTTEYTAAVAGGQLYFKQEYAYNGEYVPFAAKFSSPYVANDAYNITHTIDTDLLSSMMVGMVPYFLCYDSLNSRMVTVNGSTVIPFTADMYTNGASETHMPGDPGDDGTDVPVDGVYFPGPEDLGKYEVLQVIGCGYDALAWLWGSTAYITFAMFLEEKTSGDIYILVFDYWDTSYGTSIGMIDIDLQLFYKWPQDMYPVDPETMLTHNNFGNYHTFYFTGEGNKDIYYYDTSNAFVKKIYTSDTEITALRQGEVGNGAMMNGPYYNLFAVGDGNGLVKVLDMANVPAANADVVAEVDTDAGRITCIEFMPNNAYAL